MKHLMIYGLVCIIGSLALGVPGMIPRADAYQVNLSLYNQGFNINNFYNDGEFDVEKGIVEADPSSLLVIVGDPANVETTLNIPDIPDPFELAETGSDFHFEIAQPFRFQDRFDGLFSTTVDDPVLFVPDNGTITAFRDDGILADDRIDLNASERELPPMYVEVDYGDTITMTTRDNTRLFITQIWRNPDFSVSFNISDVPEPGTAVLLGLGVIGMFAIVYRERKKMHMKKIVPLIMFVGVVLLTTMLYSVPTYAYDIGPSFCSSSSQLICARFQEAYHPGLGQPIGPAEGFGVNWTQKFERGNISCNADGCAGNSQAQDPAEVAIMLKWQSMLDRGLNIGNPIGAIVGAWGSSYGTGGHVRFFEDGDIYYHGNGPRAGKAFEVHGRIQDTYNREGGTGSFLGFPISDEKIYAPSGYFINYFEGGCITSENGIDYDMVVKGCKEGQPIQPPKLVGANAECVKCGRSIDEQKENFFFTWEPYVPKSPEYNFSPSQFNLSLIDFMSEEKYVTVAAKAMDTESVATEKVTVINEDVIISLTVDLPEANDFKNKISNSDKWQESREYKTITKYLGKIKAIFSALNSLEKVMEALENFKDYKTLRGQDPGSKTQCTWSKCKPQIFLTGEYSKQCCSSQGVQDKWLGNLGYSRDFGIYEVYSPRTYLPYGLIVRLKMEFSLSGEVGGGWETDCFKHKVCVNPDISLDGGIGAQIAFIDAVILNGELVGHLHGDSEGTQICFSVAPFGDPSGTLKVSASPVVTGEVELFSFLSAGFESKIGRKFEWERSF